MERLETTYENIQNTIEELREIKKHLKTTTQIKQLDTIIENLESYNEEIYQVFDQQQGYKEEVEQTRKEQDIYIEILNNFLSFQDKLYYEQKYKIYLD